MSATIEKTEMTHSERRDLKKLVETQFSLLEARLEQRREELEPEVRKLIKARYAESIKHCEREAKKIYAAFQKLEDRAAALREQAKDMGLSYCPNRYSSTYDPQDDPLGWRPEDLDHKVSEEMDKLRTEKGRATLDLLELKHDILTELTVGGIKSDEAKSFLDRIPSVDQLLPMPVQGVLSA